MSEDSPRGCFFTRDASARLCATPLFVAAQYNYVEAVRLLIAAGARQEETAHRREGEERVDLSRAAATAIADSVVVGARLERGAELSAFLCHAATDAHREACDQFQMSPPKFEGFVQLEEDMEHVASSWTLYKDYAEELGEMGKQDWITFRGKLFDVQDFCKKWGEKIKGRSAMGIRDMVDDRISERLDKLKRRKAKTGSNVFMIWGERAPR